MNKKKLVLLYTVVFVIVLTGCKSKTTSKPAGDNGSVQISVSGSGTDSSSDRATWWQTNSVDGYANMPVTTGEGYVSKYDETASTNDNSVVTYNAAYESFSTLTARQLSVYNDMAYIHINKPDNVYNKEQLEQIQYTYTQIIKLLNSQGFLAKSSDTQIQEILRTLRTLVKEGYVQSGSIIQDLDDPAVLYVHVCGLPSKVDLNLIRR